MNIKNYKDKMVHSNKTTRKAARKDSSRTASAKKTNTTTV